MHTFNELIKLLDSVKLDYEIIEEFNGSIWIKFDIEELEEV